jgi:predicted dehydrogenase
MAEGLKLCVVGCGYVAQNDYFPVLAAEDVRERVDVVGVCDTAPDRAADTARRFGFAAGFTDLDAMLESSVPDLVAILTPIPLHFDQASRCLQAGAHVYVQKTMTSTLAEARELTKLAAELGRVLTASPGQMLDDAHRIAAETIAAGKIGDVCFVRGQGPHPGHENGQLNGADPAWYYLPGGGPLPDVAVYPLTSLTSLIGPVTRVTATSGRALKQRSWEGRPLDLKEDDSWVLALEFGDGVLGSVHANFVSRKFNTPQVEIFGSTGVIQLGGWTNPDVPIEMYLPDEPAGSNSGWTRPELPPRDADRKPTVRDLLHTVDVLRDGQQPLLSGRQATHVIDVIEAARRSARDGVPVEVNSTF